MALQWLFRRGATVPLRILSAAAVVILVVGQWQEINRVTKVFPRPDCVLFGAIGPDALEPNVALLSDTGAEPRLAYYIRRPVWRSPNWPSWRNPFPASIPKLQAHLPPGMELRYYLCLFSGRPEDQEAFRLLASRCEGRLIGMQGIGYAVLFDMRPLLPGYSGPPLDPNVAQKQLAMKFENAWNVPGFEQRISHIMARFPRTEE
jgi:hypothetical protein